MKLFPRIGIMREIVGSRIHLRAEKIYIQEYLHGAALFEKALIHSLKSKERERFDAIMNMALEVLNQSAQALKREDLMKQNEKISRDFINFQKNPNKQNYSILRNDLESAKKTTR
jgi:hypothetical protein